MISSSQPNSSYQQRDRSLRLIFNYQGTQIQLASQQRVEMTAPPSDPMDEYEGQSGFWIDVRDSEDSVLYRQIMHNPIQLELEAPSGDPERPFTQVKNETSEGTFMVIVPDIEAGVVLAMHSSPPDEPASPAKEIARIDLKQQRPPRR